MTSTNDNGAAARCELATALAMPRPDGLPEKWRQAFGWEGQYAASDCGRYESRRRSRLARR